MLIQYDSRKSQQKSFLYNILLGDYRYVRYVFMACNMSFIFFFILCNFPNDIASNRVNLFFIMKDIEKEFIDIIEQNQRLIYKICYIYTDNNDTLNDLYQDVMLNLWRGFAKFKGNSNISTWIYRIALNTCISYYRKEKTKPGSVPISNNIDLYYDTPDNESINQMYRMIDTLNSLDKAIILLYLEDKPYDEISEIIGISKSNVGVRLLRIKEKLTKISNE